MGRAWPLALGKMILVAYSFDFKIQEHAVLDSEFNFGVNNMMKWMEEWE